MKKYVSSAVILIIGTVSILATFFDMVLPALMTPIQFAILKSLSVIGLTVFAITIAIKNNVLEGRWRRMKNRNLRIVKSTHHFIVDQLISFRKHN